MTAWPDPGRFALIDTAFRRALDLAPEARASAITAFDAEHPADAGRLAALLAASDADAADAPDGGLPEPVQQALASGLLRATAPPPSRLGDWHIVRRLGHGGMAEVWLADGLGDHRGQRAAVKRPLPSAAWGGGLDRFDRERALLAGLNDPRIARLIDSGSEADGRPWIALEYVEGTAIDAWCDGASASLDSRVALLAEVARAVHSAHGALIVHRDIKPSNVLIEADGRVKLLDFGIAKRIDAEGYAPNAPTVGLALTPQYASPEQLVGAPLSTASDIWQLGRLLLTLLIGNIADDAAAADLDQLSSRAKARETDPPSRRLRAAPFDDQLRVATARGLGPLTLRRALGGDLDAIVLKALAIDPHRRYSSAVALADDLDAWRARRPVSAQAPTLAYRAGKLLRRNPAASLLAVVVVGLMVTLAASTLLRSIEAREKAEAAVAVRDYLIAILRQADPFFAGTLDPSAAGVLDAALGEARRRFAAQPRLLAEVLNASAGAAMRDGDYPHAAALLDEAVTLSVPLDHPRAAEMLSLRGRALHYSTRYAEAERVLRQAFVLESAQRWPGQGTTALALVDLLHSRGDYVGAAAILATDPDVSGNPYQTLMWRRQAAIIARDSGDPTAAIVLESVLAGLHRHFPDDRAGIAETEVALARADVLAGNPARARRLLAQALLVQTRIYGPHHPVIGIARHIEALADQLDGQPLAAIARLDEVLARDYAATADANVLKAYARLDRAWIRLEIGDHAAARADLDSAEAALSASSDAGHPRWAEARLARAWLASVDGSSDPNVHVIAAVDAYTRRFGATHRLTRDALRWHDALDRRAHDGLGSRLADRRLARWIASTPPAG